MGTFGNSDIQFSGNKVANYWTNKNLYGVGNQIDQMDTSKSSPGLTYDKSALADEYVSTLTNGQY